MNSGVISVLTVDDHPLLRKGIVGLVNAESDMKVVCAEQRVDQEG